MEVTLNHYRAVGLIQHSISPYSSPLVIISKTSGDVNYKKLNQIGKRNQLPIPRVDQVLDTLGSGRCSPCSTWFTRSTRLGCIRARCPLQCSARPRASTSSLVMPQGRSTSPGWFLKMINEVMKDSKQVEAYLDDVIVFDSDPIAHV